MRFLCVLSIVGVASVAGAQDSAPLWTDFETTVPHANLAALACAMAPDVIIDGEHLPVEIRAFEDATLVCATQHVHPHALAARVRMTRDGAKSSRIVVELDTPSEAAPAALGDYQDALRAIANELRHRATTPLEPLTIEPATGALQGTSSSATRTLGTHPRRGFVIGGLVLFTVAYSILAIDAVSILGSSNGYSAPWLIPVAGPIIILGETSWCGGGCTSGDTIGIALATLNAIAQAAGVAMFIYGFASPKPTNPPAWTIAPVPTFGQNTLGLSLRGTF